MFSKLCLIFSFTYKHIKTAKIFRFTANKSKQTVILLIQKTLSRFKSTSVLFEWVKDWQFHFKAVKGIGNVQHKVLFLGNNTYRLKAPQLFVKSLALQQRLKLTPHVPVDRFILPISEEEFQKLWTKYDEQNKGYITHQDFRRKLGLTFAAGDNLGNSVWAQNQIWPRHLIFSKY